MRKLKYDTALCGKEVLYSGMELPEKKEKLSILAVFGLAILFVLPNGSIAQRQEANILKVTISEAVEYAKKRNKWVEASNIEQEATIQDRNDVYAGALPTVNINGSYQRFSGLTLFTDGLGEATTGRRKPGPNAASFGVDALYNVYTGGKQLALRQEQTSRSVLARVNSQDVSGNIGLQTAMQYFDLMRLNELQKFISDQLKRAEIRLANINALYRNEKVTRSDVLRAEVNLSNVQLSLQQTENDMALTNRKLIVLLNLPDSVLVSPIDSAGMVKPAPDVLLPIIEGAGISSYILQKAMINLEVQRAKLEGIKGGNRPTVSLYAAYGLNYPNYLFFPPVDQAYAIGFVGIKAQYSISSLYHNKPKVAAGKLRVRELEVQQEAFRDNVQTELVGYFIKYGEALTRISVNERSVHQAEINYRIVNTKYLNQLALLTDLLEADNLYQESRFNLVKAQTDALGICYHILYSSGNL